MFLHVNFNLFSKTTNAGNVHKIKCDYALALGIKEYLPNNSRIIPELGSYC